MNNEAKTITDKIWEDHLAVDELGSTAVLHIN